MIIKDYKNMFIIYCIADRWLKKKTYIGKRYTPQLNSKNL